MKHLLGVVELRKVKKVNGVNFLFSTNDQACESLVLNKILM